MASAIISFLGGVLAGATISHFWGSVMLPAFAIGFISALSLILMIAFLLIAAFTNGIKKEK